MIVDSSALLAVVLAEPEATQALDRMGDAEELSMSAATLVETRLRRSSANN